MPNSVTTAVTSSDPAITFDIGAQVLDPRAISSDLVLVGSDHVPWGAITPVKNQVIAVTIELKLFLAKPLLVGPKVRC